MSAQPYQTQVTTNVGLSTCPDKATLLTFLPFFADTPDPSTRFFCFKVSLKMISSNFAAMGKLLVFQSSAEGDDQTTTRLANPIWCCDLDQLAVDVTIWNHRRLLRKQWYFFLVTDAASCPFIATEFEISRIWFCDEMISWYCWLLLILQKMNCQNKFEEMCCDFVPAEDENEL